MLRHALSLTTEPYHRASLLALLSLVATGQGDANAGQTLLQQARDLAPHCCVIAYVEKG